MAAQMVEAMATKMMVVSGWMGVASGWMGVACLDVAASGWDSGGGLEVGVIGFILEEERRRATKNERIKEKPLPFMAAQMVEAMATKMMVVSGWMGVASGWMGVACLDVAASGWDSGGGLEVGVIGFILEEERRRGKK
uniref:Uncharacterized protein n=1 Tax=Tanacetum cinerariifolium TaxID=118510 RepID=A0A6L2JFX9_TANCI|nr:hypothetical protein [Tanacetum cinerariifolium]